MKCAHYFNAFENSMLFSYFLYELVGRSVNLLQLSKITLAELLLFGSGSYFIFAIWTGVGVCLAIGRA